MSLKNTATSLIKQYGTKGRVTLINNTVTGVDDDNLTQNLSESRISLLSHVTYVPSDKEATTNNRRTMVKVLAAIDSNFDGSVSVSSRVLVDGYTLDVTGFEKRYDKDVITHVVIHASG